MKSRVLFLIVSLKLFRRVHTHLLAFAIITCFYRFHQNLFNNYQQSINNNNWSDRNGDKRKNSKCGN